MPGCRVSAPTWAAPAFISYGTALSTNQLNATASVSGTFAYSPPLGTVLPAGTTNLSVVFTPTDTNDYSSATQTASLVVLPVSLTYLANSATKQYGAANPTFSGAVTGFVNGDTQAGATTGTLAFTSSATTSSGVGSYAINGSGLSASNYTFVQAAANATALTVTSATLSYVATPAIRAVGAANPIFSGTVTGFVNGDTQAGATTGTLVFTTTATTSSPVGQYPIYGSGLSANNYNLVQAPGNATALTIALVVFTPGNDTWSGAGADNNWMTSNNWASGSANIPPISGDALFFAGTTQLNPNNNFPAATSFNGLTFAPGAGAFVLGGDSITTTGGLTNYASASQTINLPVTLSAGQNINVAGGGSLTVNNIISGTGPLTKIGAGLLTLTGEAAGADTFSGARPSTRALSSWISPRAAAPRRPTFFPAGR